MGGWLDLAKLGKKDLMGNMTRGPTPIERFFGRIVVINLKRRPDRWYHCQEQLRAIGVTSAIRFDAKEGFIAGEQGAKYNGNLGCTMSHRGVMDMIVENGWPRCLVLEDDAKFIWSNTQDMFERMARDVPKTWDMLYLGGHYAENPIARVAMHVIRMGRMFTTSSYGVTLEMARILQPAIVESGPIDSIYGKFHRERECYIFDPRLCTQYPNYSDLSHREMDNSQCMLDMTHSKTV